MGPVQVLCQFLLEDLVEVCLRVDESRSVEDVEYHVYEFLDGLLFRPCFLPGISRFTELDESEEQFVGYLTRCVSEAFFDYQLSDFRLCFLKGGHAYWLFSFRLSLFLSLRSGLTFSSVGRQFGNTRKPQ